LEEESMAAQTASVPGTGFGGLVRYNEEYDSRIKFGPGAVVAMVISVIAFVVALRIFY
jgi:preprotein translocase subunit Sec61beta